MSFAKDLQHALRMLGKRPGFTALVVTILAIGIGANTTIFSVINSLLLRPLPYQNPEQLVAIWPERLFSSEQFLFLRDQRDQRGAFERIAAFSPGWSFSLTGTDEPQYVTGAHTTSDFFSLLGAVPALGRPFQRGDDRPGAERIALLSHELWQQSFEADPNLVGRSILLDGTPHTVVGVMPAGFRYFSNEIDVWLPLSLDPADRDFKTEMSLVLGRLKPGVPLAQADQNVKAAASAMKQALGYPDDFDRGAVAVSLLDHLVGGVRPKLLLLLGGVGLILLIACVNVANMLLALAMGRQKEISIRTALGADRRRLLRQLLTESFLLASLGCIAGLLLAFWGLQVLVASLPADTPRLQEIQIDGAVLGFTLLLSLATALLFGLAPALPITGLDVHRLLTESGTKVTESARHRGLRKLLAVFETALAVVLVIGAGLMFKSFQQLQHVDPGFAADHVLAFQLVPSPLRYSEPAQRREFYRQVLERLRERPEVQSVGAIHHLPLSGMFYTTNLQIEGRPLSPGEEPPSVAWRLITPDYLRTLKIPVQAGRSFTEADRDDAPGVALVNETMARRFWPGESPVGKRVNAGRATGREFVTIVGVVGDVKHDGLTSEVRPELYRPLGQLAISNLWVVVRTSGDPKRLVPDVRQIVWSIDSDVPVAEVQTMEEVVARSISQPRLILRLFLLFAGVALVLGLFGVYGVMSYNVDQRTFEIGIRMAMGARPRDVLQMLLGEGAALVGLGLVIGVLMALGTTRLLQSLLFGVSATDPGTFGIVSLALAAFGLLACYLPARRAIRVDPLVALRE